MWHFSIIKTPLYVQVEGREFTILCKSDRPAPGLLPLAKGNACVTALFKPILIKDTVASSSRHVSLVQIVSSTSADAEDNHLRMVEMCGKSALIFFFHHQSDMNRFQSLA